MAEDIFTGMLDYTGIFKCNESSSNRDYTGIFKSNESSSNRDYDEYSDDISDNESFIHRSVSYEEQPTDTWTPSETMSNVKIIFRSKLNNDVNVEYNCDFSSIPIVIDFQNKIDKECVEKSQMKQTDDEERELKIMQVL